MKSFIKTNNTNVRRELDLLTFEDSILEDEKTRIAKTREGLLHAIQYDLYSTSRDLWLFANGQDWGEQGEYTKKEINKMTFFRVLRASRAYLKEDFENLHREEAILAF